MKNLTKYDISFVGIRLLAIYMCLQVIAVIPSWLMSISMLMSERYASTAPLFFKLLVYVVPLLSLLIPIFLWIMSNKIATFMAKTSTLYLAEDIDTQGANIKELQTLLFYAIGIFILVTTIPDFIAVIAYYLRVYIKSGSTMYLFQAGPSIISLITLALKMLLSGWLILRAKRVSTFLHKPTI